MIALDDQTLRALIGGFFWPFIRILAFVGSAPVFAGSNVPQRLKIGLAALIALLVAPTLPDTSRLALDSANGVATLFSQVLLGLAMGMILRVIFAGIELAGEIAGMQMGMNFAGFFDPTTHAEGTPVGSWLGLIATLAFLSINGHLMMVHAIAESFRVFPIGSGLVPTAEWHRLSQAGGEMFAIGVYAALPVMATMLVCNLAIGVLARIAPQLNVLSISFPVTMLAGMLMLLSSLPVTIEYLDRAMVRAVELIAR
jgi:flagellar biosynthetic protein FliR